METYERAELRAKLKAGMFTYCTTYVIRVTSINQSDLTGVVVFNDKVNLTYEVGTSVKPHNHDELSKFFTSEFQAVNAYKKNRVSMAKSSIRRAKNNIIKYQEIIDMYPEFAI